MPRTEQIAGDKSYLGQNGHVCGNFEEIKLMKPLFIDYSDCFCFPQASGGKYICYSLTELLHFFLLKYMCWCAAASRHIKATKRKRDDFSDDRVYISMR